MENQSFQRTIEELRALEEVYERSGNSLRLHLVRERILELIFPKRNPQRGSVRLLPSMRLV